jgi:hypothetical protein
MSGTLLTTIAVSISLIFVFGYLRKQAGKRFEADEKGMISLRAPLLFSVVGYLTMIMGLSFFGLLIYTGETGLWPVLASFAFFFIMGYIGLYTVLHGMNYQVRFDEEKFEVVSPFKKVKSMSWSQVAKGKFHPVWHTIKFTGENGEQIKVNHQTAGIYQFLYKLHEKTGLTPGMIGIPQED